jgi:hypothetical protein
MWRTKISFHLDGAWQRHRITMGIPGAAAHRGSDLPGELSLVHCYCCSASPLPLPMTPPPLLLYYLPPLSLLWLNKIYLFLSVLLTCSYLKCTLVSELVQFFALPVVATSPAAFPLATG